MDLLGAALFLDVDLLGAALFLDVDLLEAALFLDVDLLGAALFLDVDLPDAALFLDLDLSEAALFLDLDLLEAGCLFLTGTVIQGSEDDEEESLSDDEDKVEDDEDGETSFINVLGLSLRFLVVGLEVAVFLVFGLEVALFLVLGLEVAPFLALDLDLDLVVLLGDFSALGSSSTMTVGTINGLDSSLVFGLDVDRIAANLLLDVDLAGLAPLLDVDLFGAAFLLVADLFFIGTVIKGPEDDEEESVSEDGVEVEDEEETESFFFNVLGLEVALFSVLGFEVALFLVFGFEVALFLDLGLDKVLFFFFLVDFSASGSSLTMTDGVFNGNGLDSSSTKIFLGLISGLNVDLILDSSIASSVPSVVAVIGGGTASNLRSIFGF